MSLNDATRAAIKQRAAYFFSLFQSVVSQEKAKACAILCVEQLRAQYEKMFVRLPENGDPEEYKQCEMEYEKNSQMFDELIKAIRAF